ncbi:MAG: hypothetical protein BroJett038_34780 [Chloroflexota bacterium]|nr:hypothetical protein [Anaerolineae bacterium CFX8]GIL14758.1 MAG: hypothetical protein BroJett038_34780 [Chloroflexota bacterium]
MRPIVDGLQDAFSDRVAFVYLNAADGDQGQAVYERLALPGHPGYVIFLPDGREIYRGFGIIAEETLQEEIEAALER